MSRSTSPYGTCRHDCAWRRQSTGLAPRADCCFNRCPPEKKKNYPAPPPAAPPAPLVLLPASPPRLGAAAATMSHPHRHSRRKCGVFFFITSVSRQRTNNLSEVTMRIRIFFSSSAAAARHSGSRALHLFARSEADRTLVVCRHEFALLWEVMKRVLFRLCFHEASRKHASVRPIADPHQRAPGSIAALPSSRLRDRSAESSQQHGPPPSGERSTHRRYAVKAATAPPVSSAPARPVSARLHNVREREHLERAAELRAGDRAARAAENPLALCQDVVDVGDHRPGVPKGEPAGRSPAKGMRQVSWGRGTAPRTRLDVMR